MNITDDVRRAIFAAEQVLELYERRYPDDKRPRNALDAARAVLTSGSDDARYAAAMAAFCAARNSYNARADKALEASVLAYDAVRAARWSDAESAARAAGYAAMAAYWASVAACDSGRPAMASYATRHVRYAADDAAEAAGDAIRAAEKGE